MSEADSKHSSAYLVERLAELRAATGQTVPRLEMPGLRKLGRQRAAAKTDGQARAELGGHQHRNRDDPHSAASTEGQQSNNLDSEDSKRYFDRDGLQVRNLAEDVMRSITCGFGAIDEKFYVYVG